MLASFNRRRLPADSTVMAVHRAALVCPACYWSGGPEDLDPHDIVAPPSDHPSKVEVPAYFCPVCGRHLIANRVSA